jgi:tight adherence protein C
MDVWIVQLLCFMAMFFLVIGINELVRGKKRERTSDFVQKPALFETFKNEIDTVGAALEGPVNKAFPDDAEKIRNDLIVAALADRLSVRDMRGAQGLAAAFFLLAGGAGVYLYTFNVGWTVIWALALGFLGWIYPTKLWLDRLARTRQEEISKALPYAIDLLTVAMQAGQDFGAAVRLFVAEGPKTPLRQEFGIMLRQTELGKSRVEALKDFDGRIQLPELRSCVSAIVQSTEMGSSVAETLKLQAEEIRRTRFHKAERKAARAPSIMLIPIALFIMPAVFIVIFTPVFLRISTVMGGE